jgi:drug/metabolite transporter (DMT)-like permease
VTERASDIKGIGFAVAAAIAFGTLAIFAKLAYDEGADSAALLATRFTIATLLLAIFRAVTVRKRATPAPLRTKLFLLGAVGYAFESSLFFAALEHTSAAVVGLVFYSYPTWTALIGLATRLEPFRPQLIASLVLGSAGVVVVFSAPTVGSLTGPLLALGAAVAVAVYIIGIQVVAKDVEPASSALWTSAGAATATGIAALVTGQTITMDALPYGAALGLVSATAFVALYAAIARIGSPRSAVAAMLEPVTTVVLAAIFLGEVITGRVVAGAALIVAALPILAFSGRAPKRADLAA